MVLEPRYKYGGILIVEADEAACDKFDIIAAVTESGRCPFWDEFYLDLNRRYNESMNRRISLNKKDQNNYRVLNYYFNKFSKNGRWDNIRQIRHIENGFFEFKYIETGLRVIFYYDEVHRHVIVITHYFDKGGKDKTPQNEKMKMYQIKESFEKRRKKGGK